MLEERRPNRGYRRVGYFCAFVLTLMLGLACGPSTHRAARIERGVDAANARLDKLLEGQALTNAALDELVRAARQSGSGEITLFYAWGSATLPWGERERLRFFLDRVSFEARGREVLFVAVGSASDWNKDEWNDKLSARRAEAPRSLIGHQLVNTPYRWISRYGVGDRVVPDGISGSQFRHVRLVAVYDEALLPRLPPQPTP